MTLEQLDDFLDELPTTRCGEGGCGPCDLAFHRSCDPIIYPSKPSDGVPLSDFETEEDTALDIRPTTLAFFEEQEYHELGGEA
jgi:hypothetical protein